MTPKYRDGASEERISIGTPPVPVGNVVSFTGALPLDGGASLRTWRGVGVFLYSEITGQMR